MSTQVDLEGGGPLHTQLHVDLSEHQLQHTIERSSCNYSRSLLWCAIFATNLRFENTKFVDVFYRILFVVAGMMAFHFFSVWLKAKHSPRCAQKGPSGA